MTTPTLKTLPDYARRRDHPVASIYLPTEIAGQDTRKSPIRFKNLLKEAKSRLGSSADSQPLLEQLEKSCEPLIDDYDFWQHQSEGLAVFCDRDKAEVLRLPFAPPEGVFVGNRFHVKPLLRLANQDQFFFVLAFSINRCRLFRGDRMGLDEIEIPKLPASLEEALQFDDPERSLQFHSQPGSATREGPPRFHGQAVAKDDTQARVVRYVQHVNEAVDAYLRDPDVSNDRKAPLLLAAVEEHIPLYASANDYPGLVQDRSIKGNPDELSAQELRQKAWPLLEELVQQREDELTERLGRQLPQGKASTNIREIGPAIRRGQVSVVCVAEDRTQQGKFDPVSGEVELGEGDADVLNEIAAETILAGGDSLVIPAEKVPGDSGAAALYRF